MKASLRGTITGVTVNAGGTAFVNGENVTVNFFYKDSATPTANNVFLNNYTASVAVTVYVPAVKLLILELVAPLLHK